MEDSNILNYEKYVEDLKSFIKISERTASKNFLSALALLITAIILIVMLPSFMPVTECYGCDSKIYTSAFMACIIAIAAITCIIGSQRNTKKADHYRSELLSLRDITISINLLSQLDNSETKERKIEKGKEAEGIRISERAKVIEQIIQTLLNKYST